MTDRRRAARWAYATNQWKAGFTGFARMEQQERAMKVTAACGFDAIELTAGTGRWDPLGRPENIVLNFGSVDHFRLKLREWGIHRIASRFYVDVDAQVIDLARLDPARLDPRLMVAGVERLRHSRALLLNIDYPLGLAAYHILKLVARSVGELRGVYVLGKAATLNGKIGDVLIPNVVYDEHTDNTFSFAPAFSAADVEPYLAHGSVLDNQKAVTSRGTFLQNAAFLDALYRDFFTDVEMEAGPYLNAIYEQTFAERYPAGATVSFLRPPFDLGFLHYASDTPYSKGLNLGSRNLSYFGMDPTYATSLAVARRILRQEVERLGA